MRDNQAGRRRVIRYQLLNAIAALDGVPEHDVGGWLADLATSMMTGDALPAGDEIEDAAHAAIWTDIRTRLDDDDDDAPPRWPPVE